MKRRIFIRNTALTGLGAGFVGLDGCTTPGKESTSDPEAGYPFFKLSLAQWSIHKMIRDDGLDPYEFAAKAKRWGFEGLEYVSQLYMTKEECTDGLFMAANADNMVNALNQRSMDTGMKNLIMMVDLADGTGDMAVLDQAKRQKAIEAHFPWVDVTAGLGCHSMRVNMFGEFDPEKWKPAAIDGLSRLGAYAAKQNVSIIIENHGWLTSNAALLMEVIKEVNMENCGTLPDFGNFCTKRKDQSRWGECEEEYDKYLGMEQLMPAAKAVSAKSYDFDENGNETTIDFKRMLEIVKKAGYSGYVGVEFDSDVYGGERMSEEEGILATKELLVKVGAELA